MTQAPQRLTVELLSDTTFGRGEGTAGVVDIEVEHNAYGLPFLGGRALRGLLRDTWLSMQGCFPKLQRAALRVFGPPTDVDETSILRIGHARIEETARRYLIAAVERELNPLSPAAVLEALTDIRSQTSEDRASGAPARKTLRSVRVVVRGLVLEAPLQWLAPPTTEDLQCLALAVLGTRHAGLSRNRGRGHLRLALDGDRKKTLDWAEGRP
jgi:hypothetical protein